MRLDADYRPFFDRVRNKAGLLDPEPYDYEAAQHRGEQLDALPWDEHDEAELERRMAQD